MAKCWDSLGNSGRLGRHWFASEARGCSERRGQPAWLSAVFDAPLADLHWASG